MERQLEGARRMLEHLPSHLPVLEKACDALLATLRNGNKVLTCGNGGSAAEAQYLVTELVGRYRSDRRSLPAVFLGGETGMMSCIANDFAFDEVFARPLRALSREGDFLVAFTTSGNAANVVRAREVARELGGRSLALLGKGGGQCAGLATWEVVLEGNDTARIQEGHLFLLHWLCDRVEDAFPA